MKKEIKDIDPKRGIVRVTTADERWYTKPVINEGTGLPEYKAVPSVTWIAGHYPKGIGFYKWLAEKGWDESQAVKQAAGDKGSKVHNAISAILEGQEIRFNSAFPNSQGTVEELTVEEIDIIQSFLDWRSSLTSFVPVAWDLTVFSEKHAYAGSVDLIALVDGKLILIDFKTSQDVWTEYELQVSAYKHALEEAENWPVGYTGSRLIEGLAILQVGYKRNGHRYKWNELEDKFHLFQVAKEIWAEERSKEKTIKGFSQKDYPLIISPAVSNLTKEAKEVIVSAKTKELLAKRDKNKHA